MIIYIIYLLYYKHIICILYAYVYTQITSWRFTMNLHIVVAMAMTGGQAVAGASTDVAGSRRKRSHETCPSWMVG